MPRMVSARKPKNLLYTLKRLLSYMGRHSLSLLFVAAMVIISVLCNLLGTYMISPIIDSIVDGGGMDALVKGVSFTAFIYIIGVLAAFGYSQVMNISSQKIVYDIRKDLFSHMQTLPLSFFDTHQHGDVMSYYTNDIDTLRQMIAQSIPQLMISGIMCITLVCFMLYSSLYLTLIVLVGIVAIVFVTKFVGGGRLHRSQEYFSFNAVIGNNLVVPSDIGNRIRNIFFRFKSDHLRPAIGLYMRNLYCLSQQKH